MGKFLQQDGYLVLRGPLLPLNLNPYDDIFLPQEQMGFFLSKNQHSLAPLPPGQAVHNGSLQASF